MLATPVYGHRLDSLLSAYLDGELPASATIALTRHLAECSACRDDLEGLLAVKLGLRALRTHRIDGKGRTALMNGMRAWRGPATA